MATYIQNYDNWPEKALVNFLTGLVSDNIQRNQQRADNREYNRAIDAAMRLNNTQNEGKINPPEYLNMNNTDGWSRAFQAIGSGLGEFDTGTSGLVPSGEPSRRVPTQAEMLRNFASTMGQKEYSHLNATEAMKLYEPYMNAAEAQRVHDLQKELGLKLDEAGDYDDYIKALAQGVNEGLVNLETLKELGNYARYRQPYKQPYTQSTGGTVRYGSFDPITGEYTPSGEYGLNLSPEQAAERARWNSNLRYQREKDAADRASRRYEFDRTSELRNRELDMQARGQRKMFASGGKLYYQEADGSATPVMSSNRHLDAPQTTQETVEWTKLDDAFIKNVDDQLKETNNELNRLKEEKLHETDMKHRDYYDTEINRVEAKKAQLQALKTTYIQQKTSHPKGNSVSQAEQVPQNSTNQVQHGEDIGDNTKPPTQESPSVMRNTVSEQKKNSVFWRKETTDEEITLEQYQVLVQAVLNGEKEWAEKGIKSQFDLDRYLEGSGYRMQPVQEGASINPNDIASRRKALQDKRAREEIELQIRAGVPEWEIRAAYPNYDELVSSGEVAGVTTPSDSNANVEQVLPDGTPENTDYQVNIPDTLQVSDKSAQELFSMENLRSGLNELVPAVMNRLDYPGEEYSLEERASDVWDEFYRGNAMEDIRASKAAKVNNVPQQSNLSRQVNSKASRYEDLISRNATKYDVEPELIKAIIQLEHKV